MEATLKRRSHAQQFASKIATLRLALCPLYPLPAGAPHPCFPSTILNFWLLSESQLDSLAAYYSQVTRDEYTDQYPKPMDWDADFMAEAPMTDAQRVQVKRRKFGKFIGLRGCDTPLSEVEMRLETTQARLRRIVAEEEAKEKTMPMRRWW
ncbi:hypothetical protein K490DRAFT_40170 [Saccharata proteae CBS 121410]|uniref:Uncharacterized protein n=1 Tax=Saccharata proteae CBS 121410 TaxID=1314787 RepID=A0A9P4M0U7_9PEZI|nr:hypothetical protein K490DRAFT_40170 [Saccharata proteae CBS 121410]